MRQTSVRVRLTTGRLKGLTDPPRPGAPRKIPDQPVEMAVTWVLTEKGPGQDTQWT
jgi:hypothetical protein